jgi:tRNA threonylcarbamoyladenosine biosynthesis protein TsaB
VSPTLAISGSNLCGDAPFSVALQHDGETSVANVPAGERGDLAQLCQRLCAARGVAPAALRRVVVDVGPGSYTGLRVAVTFVRLLQQFGDLQVEGVCSLAVLARHAAPGHVGPVRTVLDARRGRLHTAVHELGERGVLEREAANAAPVDEVLGRIASDELLVAPAAFAQQLRDERGLACVAAVGLFAPALLADGLPRFAAAAADLEPRYLMASYAED